MRNILREKDPDIFNLCIKNWLVVLRNEVGEEKGATYKGIGIGLGYFQDEERTINAKHRLKVLTGYSALVLAKQALKSY
ncbi:hypothetical protein BH11CYA1_BH11CYA1_13230 [soil metagenome]